MEHTLYTLTDLLGAFVGAVSGALAAKQRRLDLFGIYTIAYFTACAGGIFRDLCIGVVLPVGISDWRYLACSVLAASLAVWWDGLLNRFKHPVLFFDAVGLGFYAVVGAHKALLYGHNAEAAIILGTATAVGGGLVRDVLLNRVPVILEKEIYATAALVGAAVQVVGEGMGWSVFVTPWFGASVCICIRLLSLHYGWQLRLPKRQ